jgi:polar amino acid transport system substrate-binding protein
LQIFILVLPTLLLLIGCTPSHISSSKQTNSVYNRVLQSGKIRAAYAIYPPYCMKDPNTGKMSGIGIEALELTAKKLGLSVEYTEEVGWGNLVEGLQANRYDMVAMPVWTNPSRAKVCWFSKPLGFNPLFAFARKGDQRFKPLSNADSPDITTASIDGTTEDLIARTECPRASHLTMPQLTDISQEFLNVATKKADLLFAEPGFASRFMKNNPGVLENIDPNHPVRIYSTCWVFKRAEAEFKAMLDTVIDEINNSGEMERIIRKYEPNRNALFLVVKPYQKMP